MPAGDSNSLSLSPFSSRYIAPSFMPAEEKLYRKVFDDSKTSDPEEIIANRQEESLTQYYSFPSSTDTFNDVGQSQHTIQIIAYKSISLTDSVDGLLESSYNTVSELINIIKANDRNFDDEKFNRLYKIHPEALFTFYMPSPIIFRQENKYENIDMNKLSSVLDSAADGIMENMKEGGGKVGRRIMGVGAGLLSGAVDAAKYFGYPIRPIVELLFETTDQRTFQFEFHFTPSSESEARTLEAIIKKLRAVATPTRQLLGGLLWKSPDSFDIKFLHNGVENTKIPKINECVCTSIEVDYTSMSGDLWSTFRTGHPVTTRVLLSFTEKELLDRQNVERGF